MPMKNDTRSRRKKERRNDILVVTIIFLVIAAIVIVYFNHFWQKDNRSLPMSDGVEWSGEQNIDKHKETKYIAIPGLDTLYFKANEVNQPINIYNPEQNECIMTMTLEIIGGDAIWHSGEVLPGYGFYDINLEKTLSAGEYNAVFIIECNSLETGQKVNGGVLECRIVVTE